MDDTDIELYTRHLWAMRMAAWADKHGASAVVPDHIITQWEIEIRDALDKLAEQVAIR